MLKGAYDATNPAMAYIGLIKLVIYLASGHADLKELFCAAIASFNPFEPGIDDYEKGSRAANLMMILACAAKGAAPIREPVCTDGINCFVAGTPVRMADGSTRPIEEVREGDEVESRDPATGRTEAEKVTKTLRHRTGRLVTLTLAEGTSGEAETVVCTPEHPFNVPGKGFAEAGNLKAGGRSRDSRRRGAYGRGHRAVATRWRGGCVQPHRRGRPHVFRGASGRRGVGA
jgi:hypothetical protein